MKSINLASGCLKINGRLVLPNLAVVSAELDSVNMAEVVTVDLAGVSQVDSAGIALLLALQQRSSAHFVLVHAPASLKTLLGLYNLTEMLPITEETV
ncbi:MAG: STAS domain-containing protein [Thiomicrospira sp.]|uniref:STAS domain-containing protein n=1 Tax=Thiomicrospira sp. TaxID=935 RepID=UPI001A0AA812|nr:STAS domain-containing protein [Thiomicrospira sp.]MBE0493575.1 STAS domain-containing protein [Thiomicrospira sp.]